jgi:hypothetical protein
MLHLVRLSVVGVLLLSIGACAAVPRYLAGQGDPTDYSWQTYGVAPSKPRQPVAAIENEARRGTLLGAGSEIPPPVETPEPAPASGTISKKSWSDDLKDCMAPYLKAEGATAGASTDATIRRSEDSPMVAQCMSGKGYRKVYRQWNF